MEDMLILLVASVIGGSIGTFVGGLALHYALKKLNDKRQ